MLLERLDDDDDDDGKETMHQSDWHNQAGANNFLVQSAGAEEYTDRISAEG